MKATKYILLTAIGAITLGLGACSDDDKYFDSKYQSCPIEVTKVYLEDYESSVPDREVDFVRLGQTLRLEGKGFMGLKKVYINGYDTYFNRNLVTDGNMIISVNSKTPIVEAEEDVRNTIRLVKDDTETTIPFTVRAASPTVKSISNTLPMPGETVTVYGTGLQEVTAITLPGGTVITEGIQSDDVDGEWYSFTMPEGVTAGGALIATCANGTAQSPDYFNYADCMILNFDGKGTQGYWSWSETGSMINNEDLVDDPLGKRGKCLQLVPDRLLANGVSSAKSRVTECWTAGNDDADDDWNRMTEFIPATTPVTEVALQFDIYCPEPWGTTGQLEICLINNYNFGGYTSDDNNSKGLTMFFIPWLTNGVPFQNTGWTTVTIPFSEMGKYKALVEDKEAETPTFADIIADRNAASYRNFGMGFVNSDFTYDEKEYKSEWFYGPKIYIDNWRVVPCKSVTISDFPEEEEETPETPAE